MYPLMDHEDFQKSRKALMATAAFMIVVNELELTGKGVNLGGFAFEIKEEVLVGFATVFLMYFFGVFILRALEHVYVTRYSTTKDLLANYEIILARASNEKEKIENKFAGFTGRTSNDDDGSIWKHSHSMFKSLQSALTMKAILLLLVEIGAPLLLTVVAFVKVGSLAHARAFLF